MNRKIILKSFSILLLSASLVVGTANALSLKDARSKGIVGELSNGYIEAIGKSSEAKDLAKDVNQKRKGKYKQISADTKQDISTVQKIAAEKIYKKASSGTLFKKGGSWVKK